MRRRAARPSRSSSPSCTPAASSATAAATRSPAACTASASRSSTRSASASRSRSAATATSGARTTSAARRRAPLEQGEKARETGTSITLRARRRDLRGDRVRLLHARAAPARDRLPHARPAHHDHRRARRGPPVRVPLRGRHRGLRPLPQRGQGARPQEGHLLRGRERRGRRRGRDAVERLLPGVRLLVRQQHQHARGRLAPVGLPLRAHAHAQQLRARQGRAQGEGRQPRRARTCARV